MNACDHTVGVTIRDDGDLFKASEASEYGRNVIVWTNKHRETMGRPPVTESPRDIFMSRVDTFTFCPDCGEKIDWEAVFTSPNAP